MCPCPELWIASNDIVRGDNRGNIKWWVAFGPGEGYSQSPEPPFLCEKLLMNPCVTLEKEMDFLEISLFKWQNL